MRRRAEPSVAELQFSFPLTHETVLAMMACFSNEGEGCLLPTPFVIELLTKQEELLRALPNIVEFEVPPGQQICIVGDIHGQYADLMHAFYMHGFPSLEKPYLERVLMLSSLLGARASELGRRLGRLVGRLGLGLSLRLSRHQLRTQGDPCRTPRHFRRKHLLPMHAKRLLGLTELSGQLRLVSFEHRRCALGSPQVSL
jgi:hypothetical protein